MLREIWYEGSTRRYWWATALLMLAYVPACILAITRIDGIQSLPLRILAALAPMPFVLAFGWLEYHRIRRTDELRQRMELEAGMLALGVSFLVLTAVGLLDNAGIVHVPLLLAIPLMSLIYIVAQVVAHRRYR